MSKTIYAQAEELLSFQQANPSLAQIDAFIIDLCGQAIGKRLPVDQSAKLYEAGTPICAAMQLVDVLGNTADPMGYGFSNGDPDAFARPLAGQLVTIPWLKDGHAQVLCSLIDPSTGDPFWYDPRHILSQIAARFEEMDLKPVAALELEFYLIQPTRGNDGEPIPATSPHSRTTEAQGKVLSLAKLDEFSEILDVMQDACRTQGIPVTTMISEYGAGQFEINLAHQDDMLAAADHAALLRRALQGAARALGFDVTFMSKPFLGESGSGLHVHLSLEDEHGNVFDPARQDGERQLAAAVGGLQATMAEAMAFFAPNLNVYRRFKPDEFTPVTRDWGENNRSVAFRLPIGDGANRRLEHRIAGADANPYLVLAAILAGVHHGLTENLDAGEKHTGNAGSEIDETLPLKLWDALQSLQQAAILPKYFGADYLSMYGEIKTAELDAFLDAISAREYDWYA